MLILLAALCLLGLETGVASPAEKIRIGIIGFGGASSMVSAVNADAIENIFTRELAGSTTIEIYERQQFARIGEEIKRNASGLFDEETAVKAGKQIGVRYILLGTVDELYSDTSGGERRATATLGIRVIETETSKVSLALSETASASESAGSESGASGGGLSRVERRAISDAASRLCHAIRASLGREIPSVVEADGNNVYIDVGSTMGSKVGNLYLVYAEGKVITGRDGTVLGRERFHVAVVKVSQVQERLSVCAPSGGYPDRIRVGDLAEPISQAQARDVAFSLPSNRGQAGAAVQAVSPPVVPQPAVVAQAPPAPAPTPPPSNTKTTTTGTTPSQNPFLGKWTATEGSYRDKSNRYNFPLKEGSMLIRPSGAIEFSVVYKGEIKTNRVYHWNATHVVKLSEFQGKLPKKISWKELRRVIYNSGRTANEWYNYTLELKKNGTVSLSVDFEDGKRSATFKPRE
jgi:hypothetical protein